jgi:DNA-binding MarR family transcriptional regulator
VTASPGVPLARLFATAFRDLVEGLHEGLGERGWADVRPVHGFVLLSASSGPTSASELAALLGTSKQAAAKLVEQMADAGYLERRPDQHDRRVVRVSLTERGRELMAAVESRYAELEAQWAQVIGVEAVERLRADLETVLRARHGGELPAVRPTW